MAVATPEEIVMPVIDAVAPRQNTYFPTQAFAVKGVPVRTMVLLDAVFDAAVIAAPLAGSDPFAPEYALSTPYSNVPIVR